MARKSSDKGKTRLWARKNLTMANVPGKGAPEKPKRSQYKKTSWPPGWIWVDPMDLVGGQDPQKLQKPYKPLGKSMIREPFRVPPKPYKTLGK